MTEQYLTYDDLVANGWLINEQKGVSNRRFTSLSFCLYRDGKRVKCVQGYGPTRDAALLDATAEANAWLRAEQIVEIHRRTIDKP